MKSHSVNPQHSQLDSLLGRLADDFIQRCRQGEDPDIEGYAVEHPEVAEAVRQLFPALRAIQAQPEPPEPETEHDGDSEKEREKKENQEGVPESFGQSLPFEPWLPDDYEIIDELGQGGMGIVYRARQKSLDRQVALKMIRHCTEHDPTTVERFRREAMAMAKLRHPNIVQIYEVGEHQGRLFFSMEALSGGSLADQLQRQPQPLRTVAERGEVLASAIHVAHENGLIHRDLKPGNVLLDQDGTLKITDFGLARPIDDSTIQTQTGAIVGTPCYMAPEQASGATKSLGPGADIYALGVILYEMITGHPPFQGSSALETLDQVRQRDPISPRQLQTSCPKDLETICLKCLRKEPKNRYPTAEALATDLRAFLEGRAILARPLNLWQRAGKWAQRRPAQATAVVLGMTVLLSLAALVLGLVYASAQSEGKARAEIAAQREQMARIEAENQRKEKEALRYARTIQAAYDKWMENQLPRARQLLLECPGSLRGWEWSYLNRLCHQERLTLELYKSRRPLQHHSRSVAFTPDGQHIVSIAGLRRESVIRAWNVASGEVVLTHRPFAKSETTIQSLALSPKGDLLAVRSIDRVAVWNYPPTQKLYEMPLPARLVRGSVELAFSPNGKELAVVSGNRGEEVSLWESGTGKLRIALKGHRTEIQQLKFTPDGKQLITGDSLGAIKVWSTDSGKELLSPRGHAEQISALEIVNKGKRLLSAAFTRKLKGEHSEIFMWSLNNGGLYRRHPYVGHQASVHALKASPQGDVVALGYSDGMIILRDPVTLQSQVLRGHTRAVTGLAFSPDGKSLASVSLDGTLKVWHPATPLEKAPFPTQRITGQYCHLDSDWSHVTLIKRGKEMSVWEGDLERQLFSSPMPLGGKNASIRPPCFSPDRRYLALAGNEHQGTDRIKGMLWLIDLKAKEVCHCWQGDDQTITAMAYSPDGKYLATGSAPGKAAPGTSIRVRVWKSPTGEMAHDLRGPVTSLSSLGFSPNGRYLVASGGNPPSMGLPGATCVWDTKTGKLARIFKGSGRVHHSVAAISPDSRVLALGEVEDRPEEPVCKVVLYDIRTGERIRDLNGHRYSVMGMAFSPDGKRLVTTSSFEGHINFWDVKSGVNVFSISDPKNNPTVVGFSPDGSRIAFEVKRSGVAYHIYDSRLARWSRKEE